MEQGLIDPRLIDQGLIGRGLILPARDPAGHLPRQGAGDAGFSLLELLVSVAVLAVLAVGVSLTSLRGAGPVERDAQRFRTAYEQNWALAVTGRRPRGLSVTPQALVLWTAEAGDWQRQGVLHRWSGTATLTGMHPAANRAAGQPAMPAGVQPDLLLGADGRTAPFVLLLSGRAGLSTAGRAGDIWRCTGDGWAEVTCAAE